MTAATQLGLFTHRFPEVSIDDKRYRKGFADSFEAPRDAPEPIGKSRPYLAGWLDGRVRSSVPDWRL